uniref:Uncharacterized protein n=1 Tax=Glossina pallidipes TaxID=7398 RepID=A0A1B0A642_GLOPL
MNIYFIKLPPTSCCENDSCTTATIFKRRKWVVFLLKIKHLGAEQDKTVLQLKHRRDLLKRYQKRIELSLENGPSGRREVVCYLYIIELYISKWKSLSLLHLGGRSYYYCKKKFQETLLVNTDKQLENFEKLATGIKYAPVEMKVVDALKHGNEALKKMVDINEIERIMDETRGDTNVNENDVSIELDALVVLEE